MTGPELLSLLADASLREELKRLLGLPSDRVADALERLTEAQARTDASLERLSEAQAKTDASLERLTEAQAKTDASLERLTEAQARTDASLERLTEAQARTDASLERLSEAQAKTDASLARTDASLERLTREVGELSRAIKDTRVAVAALSDNVGFGLEELAAIVLPDVLLERRGVKVSGFERRFVATSEGEEELDLFAEGEREGQVVTVVGEVKSRIYRADVERFARRVRRIEAELPAPVVAVMLGFVVHPSASEPAHAQGVLVVASRPSSAAA